MLRYILLAVVAVICWQMFHEGPTRDPRSVWAKAHDDASVQYRSDVEQARRDWHDAISRPGSRPLP